MAPSAADTDIPWFVSVILVAAGVLIIGLGIPLWRRRIAPNWTYGVRFPATLADERVWYEINARGGRDLVFIGLGYLLLVAAAWTLGAAWPWPVRLLGPVVFLAVALVVDAIVLGVAAGRLLRSYKDAAHS
jgi:hypothetical protein